MPLRWMTPTTFMVAKSIEALGVTTSRWIADYYRISGRAGHHARWSACWSAGSAGNHDRRTGQSVCSRGECRSRPARPSGKLEPRRTVLLSPFDPIVWHRLRASELFGFDYLIECYTPAEKRIYGYFTLPILHRGRLGRPARSQSASLHRRVRSQGAPPGTRLRAR